jgi:hypothetical protein
MAKYDSDAVILMVRKCLSDAVEKRSEEVRIPSPFPRELGSYITDPWPVYQEFYEGDHWSRMGQMPAWKSLPVDNFPFVVVESNTTKLTDGHPKVEFAPRDPDSAELAKKLNSHFNYWWEKGSCAAIDALAVKDSRKFCVGWLHLRYDKSRKKQVMDIVHPESVWVDRDTTAESFFSDEPNYLVYEYVVSVADILAAHPDLKMEDLRPNWLADATPFERIRSFFTANKTVENAAMTIPCYELWIRDASTRTWEETFGDTIIKKRGLTYPGGRMIRVAGGVVLDDVSNPHKHGQFPFAPIHCYPESGKFYGGSDIKTLLPLQVVSNKYDQILIDSAYKSGGGIGLVNTRYGLFSKTITNDVVQIHEVTDVEKAMKWYEFPAASRHIVNHKQEIRAQMQDIAGLHDSSLGRFTPGNKTAREVGVINESDNTRVRLAAKFHSMALVRIGYQWLANEAQYGSGGVVRLSGDDGKETIETLTKKELQEAQGMDVVVGDFAMLPDRYQEIKAQAFQLRQMGDIDREELLRVIEWPNYKSVVARLDKAEQAAMAQQAAAAQPPAAPAPEMGAPPTEDMLAGAESTTPSPDDVMAALAQMTGGGMPSPQGQMPPDMSSPGGMGQNIQQMGGGAPMMGQGGPPDAELMRVISEIAQQNGMQPEEVLAMLQQGG